MNWRFVIAVVALASAASADPAPDHVKATELFEEGRQLMIDHDPEGACAKFAESIRIEPLAAGTMLNLGLCHQQLDHYKTALYWFRKAQIRASETDPPLPAYEKEARERTAYLMTVVAAIRIELAAGTPPDTQVSIDDELIHPEDYAHLEIDPGHHVLVATGAKLTFRKELDVTGKGDQTVVVTFGTAAPVTPEPRTPETPETPAVRVDTNARRAASIYVAIGAGAILAGSLGLTLYEKHVYNDNKAGALAGDSGALATAAHATEIARDYGTGLAIGGILAAGTALILYLTSSQTVVVPAVAPGQAGAVLTGRF
ncbi:MAG TPA: hypothetical protein VH143_05365 [Kofleriaceae bacterium]|jgi:hypothetical protein|nr:hypothetical protein [Kofleriaceae bacterium]